MPEINWGGEPISVGVAEERSKLRHVRDAVTLEQSDDVAERLLRWPGRNAQQDGVSDVIDSLNGLDALGEREES